MKNLKYETRITFRIATTRVITLHLWSVNLQFWGDFLGKLSNFICWRKNSETHFSWVVGWKMRLKTTKQLVPTFKVFFSLNCFCYLSIITFLICQNKIRKESFHEGGITRSWFSCPWGAKFFVQLSLFWFNPQSDGQWQQHHTHKNMFTTGR